MIRQALARGSAAALVIALASCGSNGSQGGRILRVTRTDSASIEIVTTETAAADVPVFATLDSAPGLRIGSLDGPKEEQFGSVTSLAPLSDGGIAVLDAQAKEVRVFGPDGAYVRTVGRQGEGPGELSGPSAMARLGADTLAVYDYRNARVTLFGPDGALARTVTLSYDGYGRPYRAAFFADGSLVGQVRYSGSSAFSGGSGKPTFVTDSAALVVNRADGSLEDTVDVLPSSETLRSVQRSGQMMMVSSASSDFGRVNVFDASPDGVWSGYGDRFALRLLDPADGHLKRILRAPGLDRPLTDAEAKQIRDQDLASAKTPEERRRVQEMLDLSPRPELRPSYDRLVVDDQARLWVRRWPGAGRDHHLWWVFSRDGALLGSVSVPGRLRIMAIQGNHVWGVVRDELDVPYVVRYAMHRAGA